MTCLASELTLKEGAPTVALEQVMATMQRLQAWRLICVLWFAFCENHTIEPRCPLHLNVVSTNVLHTYRNIIFLTSGPEAHRYKHSARFFLGARKPMRATANSIMSEGVTVHGKTAQEPQLYVSPASPQNSRPPGDFKIRTYLACSFARNPATLEPISVKLFVTLTTAYSL